MSLYPLKTNQASNIINSSIDSLGQQGIEYSVGSISTHVHGDGEQVWQSLRQMFDNAQSSGEVSMVVTITNSAD